VTRLHLVRHGQAAAGWGADHDPGLDDVGRAQAAAVAESLAPLGPLPIVVSPLRRTLETAGAFGDVWPDVVPRVDAAVGEIPSPTDDLASREAWLVGVLAGRWADLDDALRGWRRDVVDALLAMRDDTVVVTHFVAINAAVGTATADDRLVCFRPDNCSVTVLEHDGSALRVVELGAERGTAVL
jgi:broad specificity phosphatase PhoE